MKHKFKFALMVFAALLASSMMMSCGNDDDDDEVKPSTPETPEVTPISTYGSYGGTTYFKYPVMDWGISTSKVKSQMSGFTLFKETSTVLTYNAKYKEMGTFYTFESGQLKASAIAILSYSISSTALTSILTKDFTAVGTDEENYAVYFVNRENKLACALQIESSGTTIYYLILWFEFDSSSTRATDESVIEHLHSIYKDLKPTFELQ